RRSGRPSESARSTLLLAALVVDAEHRPRPRLETLVADRLPAPHAVSVAAVLDPRKGAVDRLQDRRSVVLEAVVHLPVERDRRDVAGMVVVRADLLLVRQRPRVLAVQVLDRVDDPLALLEQQTPEMVAVHGRRVPPRRRNAS